MAVASQCRRLQPRLASAPPDLSEGRATGPIAPAAALSPRSSDCGRARLPATVSPIFLLLCSQELQLEHREADPA